MTSVAKSLGSGSVNGAEKVRYHGTRDQQDFYCFVPRPDHALPTTIVLPRNLQQDNVHPHYAADVLLAAAVTVPPGFTPVQVATELGSSASNVCV